jgi:hypothetical protein
VAAFGGPDPDQGSDSDPGATLRKGRGAWCTHAEEPGVALRQTLRMTIPGDRGSPGTSAHTRFACCKDAADLRALEYLEAGGATTTINLGTGVGSSVLEVIAASERVIGLPVTYERRPRRAGDPVALYSGNERARSLIDWEARYGLDDIMASAWAWHSTHVDGYGD